MKNTVRGLSLILCISFLFPPRNYYSDLPKHLAPVSNLSELALTPRLNRIPGGITAPTLQDGYIQQGFFSALDFKFHVEERTPKIKIKFALKMSLEEETMEMDSTAFSKTIRRILLDAENLDFIEKKLDREATENLIRLVKTHFRDPELWKNIRKKMRDDITLSLKARLDKSKQVEKPVRFIGFKAIVHDDDDFILGNFQPAKKKLYLAEDFIEFLRKRGSSSLIDEYLLHLVLCGVVGHYNAIVLQQKLFPAHYYKGNFVEEGGLKYLPDHAGNSNKLYKGALGEAIREFLQLKKSHRKEFPSQKDKILFYCKELKNYLERELRLQLEHVSKHPPAEMLLYDAIFRPSSIDRQEAAQQRQEAEQREKIIKKQLELLSPQMNLLGQFLSNESVQKGLFKLTCEEIFEIMVWELEKKYLDNRHSEIDQFFGCVKFFLDMASVSKKLGLRTKLGEDAAKPIYEFLFRRASIAQRSKMEEENLRALEGKELPLITGENTTLRSWAENLLDSQPIAYRYFIKMLNSGNFDENEKELLCIVNLFGNDLKKDEQQAISKRIFEKLNKGEFSQKELELIGKGYEVYVVPFVRRIGLIQREDVAIAIYKTLFENFKKTAEEYRLESERRSRDADPKGALVARTRAKKELESFYLYNPSKELLKAGIHQISKELSPGAPQYKRKKSALPPGARIPLLSDREVNALGWIINNSPKNDKTRDQRRWLHKFVLDLVERRIQREEDEVSLLMSALLVDMQTNEPSREKNVATVLAFLHFSLFFETLTKELQRKVYKKLHEKVEEWGSLEPVTTVKKRGRKKEEKKKAPRKKLYLVAQHYQELKQILMEALLDNIYVSSQTLTSDEKQMLREHVRKYPEAWQNDGFLILMVRYRHFQDEEGKAVVEKFLKMLSQSEVRDGHFVNLPRYNWAESGLKEWFGAPLIEKFQKGAEVPYAEEKNGTNLKSRFSDIWHDILVHLGLHEVPEENWREKLEAKWKSSQSDLQEFENFWNLFGEIQQALEGGEKVESSKIQGWKKQWSAWQMERKIHGAGEVLVNLDQIAVVQQMDAKQLGKLRFVVTEDPVEFIRSGERPYNTCQRCVEPTGQNGHGTPVNRPRQGHFLLAQVRDQEGEVLARSILEIARSQEWDGTSKKVLLVERIYQKGVISTKSFQRHILDWVLQDKEISYVVFSGGGGEPRAMKSIEVELLPSDGKIYRDTLWSSRMQAVDMEVYRKLAQPKLNPMDQHKVWPSSSRRRAAPANNLHQMRPSLTADIAV